MSVEAARVGQHPQLRAAEPGDLATLSGFRFGERLPVRRETEHGHNARLPAPHVCLQRDRAGTQIVEAQLLRTGTRGRHDVGDADREPEHQFAIRVAHAVAGINQVRGDAGCVQRRPEAVAATSKVSVDGSGPQSRVDPDEQQSDAIVDQVVHRLAMERSELRASEPQSRLRRGSHRPNHTRMATMVPAQLIVMSGTISSTATPATWASTTPTRRRTNRGGGTSRHRPPRCVRAERDRATGTCPTSRPGHGRTPSRCGRRPRPA